MPTETNEEWEGKFKDLERRSNNEQRRFYARNPKKLGNVLAKVVQQKAYAQIRTTNARDEAWQAIAGEFAALSKVGPLRRNTLEIIVANSLLMQELTFRKEELIKKLQTALPDTKISQLRFRVGQVN